MYADVPAWLALHKEKAVDTAYATSRLWVILARRVRALALKGLCSWRLGEVHALRQHLKVLRDVTRRCCHQRRRHKTEISSKNKGTERERAESRDWQEAKGRKYPTQTHKRAFVQEAHYIKLCVI